MRLFRLALLSTAALAVPLHAAPRFSFSGSAVNAGSHAPFIVTRTGGTGSTTLTFTTLDAQASSTAKAGLDYVTTTQILRFGRTLPKSITVNVSTMARSGVTGSLTFSASITGKYVPLLTATSTIFEAAAPPATQTCPDGSVIPSTSTCPVATPPPTPTPTPTPSGYIAAPSLAGVAPIASEFNPLLATQLMNGTGTIPPSGLPDNVGAFRFLCGMGALLYDDPVVKPGQPGKSHLHQFYGNTLANAYSTFNSLRTSGQSTCNNGTYAANRSAYWTPAMFDGKGNVVQPDYAVIYYKRRPITDPTCSLTSGSATAEGNCVDLPNGLRFVFGWDPTGLNSARTGAAYFNCDGPSAVAGHYLTLTAVAANCPAGAGNRLGAIIAAPECWDGTYLDTPDHRSHVGYAGYGGWGYLKCDSAHPYVIPTFQLAVWYTVAAGDDPTKWSLSSDAMAPGQPPGYTLHGDYFEGWDKTIKDMWHGNCINLLLNCNSGDMGNGKQLIGAVPAYGFTNPVHLVPVPAMPAM